MFVSMCSMSSSMTMFMLNEFENAHGCRYGHWQIRISDIGKHFNPRSAIMFVKFCPLHLPRLRPISFVMDIGLSATITVPDTASYIRG
jgi:hypothetical protein